ncbi:hypothetical protein PGTUg99_015829 [Puccinia graminis f. sp. tritici]|uniref:Uncharacterized protein n=1 Tax=Puccinia graminis f. sp. tritici TaxID=56615 RepID=A0A5B0Q1W2_PUCGR|nr:hypothetical protein PGTUg99_015829 [Puccinia graminis f. sp. tritici]
MHSQSPPGGQQPVASLPLDEDQITSHTHAMPVWLLHTTRQTQQKIYYSHSNQQTEEDRIGGLVSGIERMENLGNG